MAPTTGSSLLARAVYCNDNGYNCYSTWNDWGRWVALAVIVVSVLLIAFMCSCYNTRRRRQRGLQPTYGMGWMAKPPQGQHYGQTNYYPNQPYNGGAPAPPYTPAPMGNQATGTTFNSNDGYYGNQYNNNSGIQQPQSSYQPQRGGDPVYEAPLGPPPAKGDGIIR